MYRFWKRAVSVILSVVLMVTLLPQAEPTAVSAAETQQSAPVYNRDIINALSDIVGGEEEAQAYYQMLQSYGLIDDEGNILDKWKIEMDGKEISLDEIKEILAGDFDPNKIVWVDGTPVTLADLAEMIAIEEYLSYLKETYFTEKTWTSEQVKNAQSFVDQISKEGILLRTAYVTDPEITTGARNVSHNARVTVKHRKSDYAGTEAAMRKEYFDVTLTGANPGQAVSFNTKAYAGSRKATSAKPIVSLKAGNDGTATTTIIVVVSGLNPDTGSDPLYSAESSYVLNCYNIRNALFTDENGNDCENLGVVAKCNGTLETMPNCLKFDITGNTGLPTDDLVFEQKYIEGPYGGAWIWARRFDEQNKKTGSTVYLTGWQEKFIKWGLIDKVEFKHAADTSLPLNNPSLEFSNDNFDGVISGNAEWQPIHAANDDPDETVDVSVSSLDPTKYQQTLASGLARLFLPSAGESALGGVGRQIQAATYQFIVNRSDGVNESEWYNHSIGYKPEAYSNEDYASWDWVNLLPTGGYDMKKDSHAATALKKGDVIKSLTFDGGMAYYPLRMYKMADGRTTAYTFWPSDYGWQLYAPAYVWDYTYYRSYPDLYMQYAAIQGVWPFAGKNYEITASFSRESNPTINSITIPDGTFRPGELIPITVRYSEPAKASTVMIVNDKALAPVESSASNIQTFLWKVEENGEVSLVVRGFSDKDELFNRAVTTVKQEMPKNTTSVEDIQKRTALTMKISRLNTLSASSDLSGLAQEIDLSALDLNGLSAKNLDGAEITNNVFSNDHTLTLGVNQIETLSKTALFTGMTVTVDMVTDPSHPTAKAEINVTGDGSLESLLTWLSNDMKEEGGGTDVYASKSFRVRIGTSDGSFVSDYLKVKTNEQNIKGETLYTDTVELPVNDTGKDQYIVAELYLCSLGNVPESPTEAQLNAQFYPVLRKIKDGEETKELGIAIGKLTSAVFVEISDLVAPSVSIKASDGVSEYDYTGHEGVIFASDLPVIKASFSLNGTGFTYGDTRSVTTLDGDNPVDSECHFAWSSSNPVVATIDADGMIHPTGKEGVAFFSISALNGGKSYKDGNGNNISRRVSKKTATYQFSSDSAPHLKVSDVNYIHVASEGAVKIFAASNISESPIIVDIYQGNEVVSGAAIGTWMVPSFTEDNPLAEVLVPGTFFPYHYGYNDQNLYTVHFHTSYDGEDYEGKAHVTVESPPAVVRFNRLEKYYFLDNAGSIPISWDITSFAQYSAGNLSDLFELKITRDGQDIYTSIEPGIDLGDGHFTGTYNLGSIDFTADPSDKNSFCQKYIVSIKAKNGSDSTWSYDSFILYVYDEEALKIWVQPTSDIEMQRGAVGTVVEGDGWTSGSLTMKNSAIATMAQEEILAMRRDISLRNVISANYGEFAWTELADQLSWGSSDNYVATVNYKQGKLYEDIRDLTFESYRPGTDLLISGLNDGTATVTAKHVKTGMTEELNVTVETLKNKLYLFQCYPQVTTVLTYKDKYGTEKTVTSDSTGAAAIYDEYSINSDVSCRSEYAGNVYLGTYRKSDLESGERDSTRLELYPCNNITLRRAAFAYLYIKNSDGTPYNGYVRIRGGVNVNGQYVRGAKFSYNSNGAATKEGYEDNYALLGADGKLEIAMDQSQWGLPGNQISPSDKISYEFVISGSDDGVSEGLSVYPIYVYVDAGLSEEAFVGSGQAIVSFRNNKQKGKQPFILDQYVVSTDPNGIVTPRQSVLDYTGSVGINDNYPVEDLTTIVMWWGEEFNRRKDYELGLFIKNGNNSVPVCAGEGQSEQTVSKYPFIDIPITEYTVKLNSGNLDGILAREASRPLELKYFREKGRNTRQEDLTFMLANLLGCGDTRNSQTLKDSLLSAGSSVNTSPGAAFGQNFGDEFVGKALNILATLNMPGMEGSPLELKISPTSDPTKFVGLMKFNYSNMDDPEQNDTGGQIEIDVVPSLDDLDYTPSFEDLDKMRSGSFFEDMYEEASSAAEEGVSAAPDFSYEFGGYMETLIYYDYDAGKWAMQILDGGFNAGFGIGYTVNFNVLVGPVPITMTLEMGGQIRISMDTVSTDYYNFDHSTVAIDNEFLTKLRIYLYIKAFAGVGIDYSVIALKIGIFGQISVNMEFEWLNRPYLAKHQGEYVVPFANQANWGGSPNLNGQRYTLNGMIGLEFVAKVAFISYEKVLFSIGFNTDDFHRGDYDLIEALWGNNQTNMRNAIDALLQTNSAGLTNAGGQKFVSVNLAPRVETRDYLNDPDTPRTWGDRAAGAKVMKTAKVESSHRVNVGNIESNTYPYADPKLVKYPDGTSRIYWLSDMNSTNVNDTSAVRTEKAASSDTWSSVAGDTNGKISSDLDASLTGVGDMQLAVAGDGNFEIAAWARRMVDNGKEAGERLTNTDQMVSLYGSEVYARPSDGSTFRLTENSMPDISPAVATKNGKSIVAWRSVAMSGEEGSEGFNAADFNKKDMILFRIYNGSDNWSDIYTAYNGTQGNVKAIKAAMLTNGTAALAYTVDIDGSDATTEDREIIYSVINGSTGEVTRTVRATNDSVLDENPDLAVVKFEENGAENFVLGWYSHKVKTTASASSQAMGELVSEGDLCMLDFDSAGNPGGRLPGSLSQVSIGAKINVTSNFKFASGAELIDDLSITWVERADGVIGTAGNKGKIVSAEKPEYDVIKAAKFYTDGTDIGLTSAVDYAEMPDGTLVDSYDVVSEKVAGNYVLDGVILGTTYGAGGSVSEKTGFTVGGEEVTYYVPKAVSSMYSVSETYKNKIVAPIVYVDSETVRRGSKIGAQFVIRNDGYKPVNNLTINIDDQVTTYSNLTLLPGASATLWADYNVPVDMIRDVDYTVTASYAGGTTSKAIGKITLYRPDLAITSAKIISEEDGRRDILVKLNNASDSTLAGSGKTVEIKFYADSTMTEEIESAYLPSVTIDDDDTLKMIDEGGYSVLASFDAASYVKAKELKDGEIPENGIDIYVSASVMTNEYDLLGIARTVEMSELIAYNNTAMVTCENLKARTGKDVIISSGMDFDDEGKTIVNVEIQNTKLSTTSAGNLIVNLFDENGDLIETKQSYDDTYAYAGADKGLISLGREAKAQATFTFENAGALVTVSYAEMNLSGGDASIESLSFSNIPWITQTSFVKAGDGEYAADVTLSDVTETEVTAVAASDTAMVSITGSDDDSSEAATAGTATRTVRLTQKDEGSTVTVIVTASDGTQNKFILNIMYSQASGTEAVLSTSPTPPAPSGSDNDQTTEDTVTPTPAPDEEKDNKEEKDDKDEKLEKEDKDDQVEKAPAAERKANTVKLDKKLGVTQKNGKLSFTWGKVPDAEYYELYVVYDDEEFSDAEPIVVEDATKFSLKKIDGKKINQKKNIKYKVVAFKTESGKKVQLGESLTLCAAGTKSKEYTNVSEVTLNKTKKTLETGKTFKIKADLKLEDESKKLVDPGIKYESSDTSVAKVNSKGKITTVGKGTCYVYVRSATGAYAKIKITVK